MKRLESLGKSFRKGERGFTIIELLVALAITGLIAGALSMTIAQIMGSNSQSSNHATVIRQVQNAGYWVSHDVQMAQSDPTIDLSADGFPLVITWTEWNGTENEVTYTITGTDMIRSLSVNGVPTSSFIVARYLEVDPTKTLCTFSGGILYLTVTATINDLRTVSETREYQIVPRPSI